MAECLEEINDPMKFQAVNNKVQIFESCELPFLFLFFVNHEMAFYFVVFYL